MGLVLNHLDMLGGLNLNYSSLAAVFSALIVMGVVLLSTVYRLGWPLALRCPT